MGIYEKLWLRGAVLTTVGVAAFGGACAGAEVSPPRGLAGEGRPAADEADHINGAMMPRTIELLPEVPAGPASATARTGNSVLANAGAAANVAERASSAIGPLATTAAASSSNPTSGASPLQQHAWDASAMIGPASSRDQTPTADRYDAQLLPQRGGVEADVPLLIDTTAQESWIRSASSFLREYRAAILVGATSLFGLAWLMSALVRRRGLTAPQRRSMPTHHAQKSKRKRIRIRFRTGGSNHEHGRDPGREPASENGRSRVLERSQVPGHGQEHGAPDIKREHRRRRRHTRPTVR